MAAPRSMQMPITRIDGEADLSASAMPEIRPPPESGTSTVSMSGRSSRSSRPIVPCPAITGGWSNGETKTMPSSATNRSASTWASSWLRPMIRASAPSARMPSILTWGTSSDMQRIALTPSCLAAWATPRPWLPVETPTTPRRGRLLRALADPHLSRLVEADQLDAAGDRLSMLATRDDEPFSPGTIAIVGAGPGGRGHLTLRALDRIHRADVIVHDALVSEEVLDEALPGTRLILAGRRCGQHSTTQETTMAIAIREARAGQRVVRLHGGDPFVFGRGGEEIDRLQGEGVPFELVPGVSSALAAATAAGVPLTRRGESAGISVRTGHTKQGYASSLTLDAEDETLVILMARGAVEQIMDGLVREGRPKDTPAAAVSRATLRDQRVVVGTLETLAKMVIEADLPRPVTFIVGRVARRAQDAALAARAAEAA